MAKTKAKSKSGKPASKPAAKSTPKKAPAAKTKALKPLEKVAKAVAKVLGKKDTPAKPVATKPVVKPGSAEPKKAKAGKADKASKKKKSEEFDLEDDLLAGDEVGSEEIPDLSEFEEAEEESTVEDDSDDAEALLAETKPAADEEVVLLDADGRRYCRVRDCDQAAAVETYCRFHYLLLWKKIQVRRKILQDGKLARYVDELTARYPDKFLEMIRKDLKTEKDFLAAIAELEIDDSGVDNEFEDEAQSYIDEVRGMSDTGAIPDEEEF